MTMRASQHAFVLLSALIFALVDGNTLPISDEGPNHGLLQIEWLRSKGGYVNHKLEIRRANQTNPSSRFGMFTNEIMKEDEILLIIPRDCLITEEGADYGDIDQEEMSGSMDCGTVANLVKEMRLGDDSFYSAYVNYLVKEPWGSVPSSWSDAGQKLINNMLYGRTIYPIPPEGVTEWIRYEWSKLCNGSNDPFEQNAALMVVQRSWDNLLIPVYDMMSHRNGHWLNTKSNEVHGEDSVIVKAKRDIQSGEEMFVSYNMCEDCSGRARTYGTFEILRDYGFVEQYPQRWIFPETVGFEVYETIDGSGDISLAWIGPEPDENDIEFLEEVLLEMEIFGRTSLNTAEGIVNAKELTTIRDFHRSLSIAVSLAIDDAAKDEDEDNCNAENENCAITIDRYDDLNVDTEGDEFYTRLCDNEDVMLFEDYDIIEEIKTPYQYISVMHDPINNDMCFDLENIVQIATSYRPQYHEMVVHYAARFLKDIKRVLFVGGGDSMLLHEVVKYPNLELVVGLELDQQVTRMSFKHFGVQPLWDNENVQWWFGDATKSLLMLPKEYFGSFDMVLVDLSETVMSFKVTNELDVVEALSLLLKPDGIMVKNELYFQDMSKIFEHTLQIHYNDVPVICSQALILGSNNINFLKENITNHGIDSQNLYIMPDSDHFNIVHDYAWNPTNRQKHCKRENDELDKGSSEQIKSPGIIMCLEAENASFVSESLGEIAELVGKTLESKGLTLISSFVPKTTDNVFVIIMKEGYVATRIWSKAMYCAFDIHLWSSFEKHDSVKKAIISSIGSSTTSSSSFRVVAGGMFGVNTWKNDENNRGPLRTDACESPNEEQPSKTVNQDAIDIVLKESMDHAYGQGGSVVVVCDKENSQPCLSYEALKKVESVTHLQILWSCIDDDEDAENYPWLMFSCEQRILQLLEGAASENMKVRAIVFDQTMGYRMGQVIFKILKKLSNRRKFFETDVTAIAMSTTTTTNNNNNSTDDTWQRILMNRIRKDVHYYDPVFLGQIFYKGLESDSNVEVNVVAKDELFMQRLREVTSNIEKQAGLISDIRSVTGGIGKFNYDYAPNPFYKASDYDQSLPMEQWSSQQPLEDQTIFQLEGKDVTISTTAVKDGFKKSLELVNSIGCPSASAEVEEFSNVGDGCVLVALWSGGRAIVVWDGRNHIDINLSIVAEMDEVAAKFDEHFIKQLPFEMKTVLRDVQSRGYGRTVSFLKDTNSGFQPEWIEE